MCELCLIRFLIQNNAAWGQLMFALLAERILCLLQDCIYKGFG
ncbi:hypothetical protein ALO83_104050 [Pseudomonas cannabina pv. alisalensis]|uniref:Uncharacterized protein n=1 Tax=Pseudomonas cannabina TaxID=86840 RepID=A0A3M3QG23_PSECA|nr:Unknown protein sequence [Pseudomonas syringae pv. maculicola]KPW25912.1 hypothetical protein ALO83_104050 [Pseudomonas cannabina pv. alisalensis]RMN83119.1 hypothetical protein ALQ53_103777 [Pseudomonas cannabina]RMN83145.1 hypothetical protein ALQ52_104782 [Pseudomonas cannabina pv. alisalensis]RMN90283.1 hypothetical protein ALQ51_102365 [Pseudomonas cannabina]